MIMPKKLVYQFKVIHFSIMAVFFISLITPIVESCTTNEVEMYYEHVCEPDCSKVPNGTPKNAYDCPQKCKDVEAYAQKCCLGYAKNLSIRDGPCEDIDECTNSSMCDATTEQCFNVPGTYECHCRSGYFNTSIGQCQDIDECSVANSTNVILCQPEQHEMCENVAGSFRCVCQPGFVMNENATACIDLDECKALRQPCIDAHTECYNAIGSYDCRCQRGFKTHPSGTYCIDEDECLMNGTCINAECQNTAGSYRCHCLTGYQHDNSSIVDSDKKCIDVDECSLLYSHCSDDNETCINTPGSYLCLEKCTSGYQRDLVYGCLDINECTMPTNNCSHYCHNEKGSYSCSCPMLQLLAEDGFTCQIGLIDNEIVILSLVGLSIAIFIALVSACVYISCLRRYKHLAADQKQHQQKRKVHNRPNESPSPQTSYFSNSMSSHKKISSNNNNNNNNGSVHRPIVVSRTSSQNNNNNNCNGATMPMLLPTSNGCSLHRNTNGNGNVSLHRPSYYESSSIRSNNRIPVNETDRRPILLPRYLSLDDESPKFLTRNRYRDGDDDDGDAV